MSSHDARRWIQTFRLRVRSLFHRVQADQELDEELRFHLEQLIEQNLAAGLPADEARHAALREMGGLEQRKEECRDTRGWRWLDELTWDVRFALRTLGASRGFTTAAVASLALGIGLNTAVFSAVNALLLRPLPYPHPERLVKIDEVGGFDGRVFAMTWLEWRDRSRTLEAVAAYSDGEELLTGVGEPETLKSLEVSQSFFPTFGASFWQGRGFRPSETAVGGDRVVILSYGLWQRRFRSDPKIIGRSVRLDDRDHRVVGVLSPDFRHFDQPELWLPLTLDEAQQRLSKQGRMVHVVARLRPHVTLEQATAELQALRSPGIAKLYGDEEVWILGWRVRLTPLQEHLVGDTRRLLLILLGAVGFVLTIACANAANLMLARAVVRRKEIAILSALGASRSRLMRRMLTESALLAAAAGMAGVGLASGLIRLVLVLSPPDTLGAIARVATIDLDGRVLAATLAVSLMSGLVFGLAPALQFSRPDAARALKDGGHEGLSARHRTRQALLVVQVALTVVLLTGAGLLLRSFVKALDVPPGFRTETLSFRVELPPGRYSEETRVAAFHRTLVESISAMPGVEHAGLMTNVPLTTRDYAFVAIADDKRPKPLELALSIAAVSPGSFRAMGITLRKGRVFDERDTSREPVVVLSESLAREMLPGVDPLGKPWRFGDLGGTVIGIVEDVRNDGLDKAVVPAVYVPHRSYDSQRTSVVVRSGVPTLHLATAVRATVREMDPDVPVVDLKTMGERVSASLAPRRFTLLVVGAFALLALLLACVGVYGVIAYLVTQRTHEVGVRIALGARSGQILGLFLTHGMAFGLCGIAIGLAAAFALARVMTGLLFGITATDPLTFSAVPALLAFVVFAACWLPARRAARLAPLVALRRE